MRSSLLSSVLFVVVGVVALSSNAQCKAKKKKAAPKHAQDAIEVVGHIPPTGTAVTRFLSTQHYSSCYLYAEHEGGKSVTLIDMSKTAEPVVLADIPSAPNGASANLFAVAGTAALTSDQTANVLVMPSKTIRIMDFSDPKQPKVSREFSGVTAMSRDDRRGLIFLSNADGIWILHQSLAQDPEVEKEYARRVLYDH
jgi:hypothetical protein